LLTKLMGVVGSYCDPMQVFVTSHSPFVLNAVGAENIRLVYIENGFTHVRALTNDEIASASSYLENEGTLDEFLELIGEGGVL